MQKSPATARVASPHLPLPYIIIAAIALIASLAMVVPGDPEWWKVVVLGIVQGITEWLPISSTGHLLIVSKLLNYQGSIGGTFEIFIQVGTVVAVVAFYFQDLLKQAQALLGRSTSEEARAARTLWLGIVIAMVPAGIIGLLARDFIKAVLFETPQVIAGALIFGGIIFLVIELIPQRQTLTTDLGQVSWKQALGVGIAQILALIPGMSRSGSCIIGGLLAGLDRRTATAFSFYLAMPVLGGATLVDLISSLDEVQPDDWGRLLLGAVVSMIVGYLTIGWLLHYIARHNFVAFGIYRIIIGVLILGLVAVGVL
ncbi:undecaprenyl-diphosphate phosphatase [Candidatus Chloroploca sp. M-50]|uniref:Undecaprenyl-diphosphatase n=1 Tax=Candidatus Chloroploca mongolica TaxID=2528176 RepID=A0ABS4DEW3_9CHLR|nr:undecaprenyl-diphosphate phosphatase [Candidatus Chloroploca mongolica]MBP1467970.1 undecaprenyl-diphosphate phosphatase [Candidatus Chloroploca mongolica]